MRPHPTTYALFLALALTFAVAPSAPAQVAAPSAPTLEQPGWKLAPPKELFVVEKVVDGDTLHIRRNGELQKLRLLSVDTEEKLGVDTRDPTKPATAFGEECAQWAAEFFAGLAKDGEPVKVGILFPTGIEERDVYGRLLCYVILPDGRNFNLLLVELGKSPYFNKYGNDQLCHAAFVAAQKGARNAQRGIWNPKANEPATPGAPVAKRPYERLLPWWDARALAVDEYRRRVAADPAHVAAADSKLELARVLATARNGEPVEIFGSIDRLFDEADGSLTVLFRSGSKDGAFRAKIAAADRARFDALELPKRNDEFRQNYLWVKGRLSEGSRGFEMQCGDPAAWHTAGPELAAAGR